MLKIAIQGHGSLNQLELRALLAQMVVDCGGWILKEKRLSRAAYHLRFEVGLSNITRAYAALQQTGLEFAPAAHRALAATCLCGKYLTEHDAMRIVSIDLHIVTLGEGNSHLRRRVGQQPA